jgi:hypothetical protein
MVDSVLTLDWLRLFSTYRWSTLGTSRIFLCGTLHGIFIAIQSVNSSQLLCRQLCAATSTVNTSFVYRLLHRPRLSGEDTEHVEHDQTVSNGIQSIYLKILGGYQRT